LPEPATIPQLLIFSLVDEYTVFLVRTFSSCLPAAIVLLGVLALGAVRSLDPDARRPDYGTIAAYLDREAHPGDLVVHSSVAFPGTAVTAGLHRPRRGRPRPDRAGLDARRRIRLRAAGLDDLTAHPGRFSAHRTAPQTGERRRGRAARRSARLARAAPAPAARRANR
jgi:hypothetical protein